MVIESLWCVCVFILHSSLADFFKLSTAVAHCSSSLSSQSSHSFLMSPSLPGGYSKITCGFYSEVGGKEHDFVGEAVICARYQRGL